VLQIPRDTIMEKADLEAETVDQVMEVLSREFEDEDEEADDDEAEDADTEAEADAETETNE
jgi:ABC-type Zn2+ transport system substrate-binding protein/surface adhesin